MKKKLFILLVIFVFSTQSFVFARHSDGDKVSISVYDKQGDIVLETLPLEPPNASKIKTDPIIERIANSQVVNSDGKVIDTVSVAKNNPEGTIGTMAIGARIATVAVAADEEYRNADANWISTTGGLVEEMDDAFNRDHAIDLDVKIYIAWSSQGSNPQALIDDLKVDWASKYSYDFLIGFSKDPGISTVGGIATQYTSNPSTMASSVLKGSQSYSGVWHAGQHELSHNYGLGHDTGEVCIMNYNYIYDVDYWDSTHDALIEKNEIWYGTAY